MTPDHDHTHPEPIRLPVAKFLDSAIGKTGAHSVEVPCVYITPEIGRQIVAMAGAPPMPPPVEVPPGQLSRNPILDNYTQPAAPDADEAAVDAIAERCHGLNDFARSVLCARAILAAIRSGAIPLPEDTPQIATLRDQLRAANTGREAADEEYRRQIAEMRAKLDDADEEAKYQSDMADIAEARCLALQSERIESLTKRLADAEQKRELAESDTVRRPGCDGGRGYPAPYADEAAALDMASVGAPDKNISPAQASAIIAALRSREIQLPDDVMGIAALHARLDKTSYHRLRDEVLAPLVGFPDGCAENVLVGEVKRVIADRIMTIADRDRLAAQVESLTRELADKKAEIVTDNSLVIPQTASERDKALADLAQCQSALDQAAAGANTVIDQLKADLAAERAAHDATKEWGHVEEGKVEKLTADLAAMKERAEKAEALAEMRLKGYNDLEATYARSIEGHGAQVSSARTEAAHWKERAEKAETDLRTLPHVCREWETQRDAARAEADSLRAEVEALRRHGNKDCTAMADAEIARRAAGVEVES